MNQKRLIQQNSIPRFFKVVIVFSIVLIMSGCSSLSAFLFYPSKHYYQSPEQLGLNAERVNITTKDGEILANWFVKSSIESKGVILFLHGNGENISTHINSVAWLPQHGYDVFLLDYRGYGQSTGGSTLPSALSDVEDVHRWLSTRQDKRPLFVFGQSLGGGLAVTYTANYNHELEKIEALITESAPASWPQIAREAMSKSWITWLLQIPVLLMPGQYDAEDHIVEISSVPILLMHSKQDPVVGYHHGQQLFEKTQGHAQWLETQGGHIAGLNDPAIQTAFLKFLELSSN